MHEYVFDRHETMNFSDKDEALFRVDPWESFGAMLEEAREKGVLFLLDQKEDTYELMASRGEVSIYFEAEQPRDLVIFGCLCLYYFEGAKQTSSLERHFHSTFSEILRTGLDDGSEED